MKPRGFPELICKVFFGNILSFHGGSQAVALPLTGLGTKLWKSIHFLQNIPCANSFVPFRDNNNSLEVPHRDETAHMNSWDAVQTLFLSQLPQRTFPSKALMAPVTPGKHLPGLSRESFQVLPALSAELQPCSIQLGEKPGLSF